MCIALSSELLTKVANCKKKFENACTNLKEDLLNLGMKYISKIEEEEYFF